MIGILKLRKSKYINELYKECKILQVKVSKIYIV